VGHQMNESRVGYGIDQGEVKRWYQCVLPVSLGVCSVLARCMHRVPQTTENGLKLANP